MTRVSLKLEADLAPEYGVEEFARDFAISCHRNVEDCSVEGNLCPVGEFPCPLGSGVLCHTVTARDWLRALEVEDD